MPTSTLYLIDGYAQFFRAFHAIRTPMSSPVTKEPTNLTFGFLGMMLKLVRGQAKMGGPPSHVAVAIDVSGDTETFRSFLYPEYKANRPPPPEGLIPQVQRCISVLEAMKVPVIGVEGFEADDVIATLVTNIRAAHPDTRVRIVSKDKDLKQLLEPGWVELYDIHTDTVIDAAMLKAETGLEPRQVIDMLALMGDNVDNVPGVEGVGEKTAAALIAEHGSIDALLANASSIKGKRGENIRAAKDLLALSRQLVSLRHDAPVRLDLASAALGRIDLGVLIPICKELGFNRYQDEVRQLLGEAPVMPAGGDGAATTASAHPTPTAGGTRSGGGGAGGGRASKAAKDTGPSLFDSPGPLFADAAQGQGGAGGGAVALSQPHNASYRSVRTKAELAELVATLKAAACFAFDTETTGLSPIDSKLCGLSFSTAPGSGWYVPVRSPEMATHLDEATVLAALRPVLEDPSKAKCGHNLKFDMMVLRQAGGGGGRGVRVGGFGDGRAAATCFDSMVASYLIDATRSSHSLDALSLALLNHSNISITELIGSGAGQRTFDTVAVEAATQYAAEDADMALRLREAMLPELMRLGLEELFTRVEMPLVEVLAELELNGFTVDAAELDRQRARLAGQIDALRVQIDDASMQAVGRTINPDSPKQLSELLFGKPDAAPGSEGLGLKPVKRTATGFSTDIEVLEKLSADASVSTPIPQLILDYRQLTKLTSTYLVAIKDAINTTTGRVHASFNQTVAATGRLSSSDPNLQNIPIRTEIGREIRKAFVAAPGCVLISADYSQIELRLLAHLSRDPALIEAFEQGADIHAAVAAQIHNVPLEKVTKDQRSGAKMVNFGIVYGVTPYGLARRLGCSTSEAEAIITGYKKRFAGITTFLQECVDHAQRHGYVETMLKRRRPIPEIDSTNPSRRAFAERTAINTVVQGSAADLIKLAMIDLHARRNGELAGSRMLLQIHDELVFESPQDDATRVREVIVSRMEAAMRLSVPLKVDATISANWFDE
ncbi:MAG: DNA polymerase I [Phycisphaerales bacterium]|nr:DNA polymerase I [Phycisphaerales bacterium]